MRMSKAEKEKYDRMTDGAEQIELFGKVYGYTRISTMKQNIERQIRNIKAEYPNAVILSEAYTGTKMNRPEWLKLMKNIKADDTIVFDSVSRMSRNAEEGFQIYQELFDKGVNLVFLKEPHINTETYKRAMSESVPMTGTNVDYILKGINQFFLAMKRDEIKIAFDQAQKEVDDLHQRTKEGIETARLNGKQIGIAKGTKLTTKKSIEMKKEIRKHSKDFGGTLSDVDVMKLTKLSRNTYYKYKREMMAER